MDSEKICDLPKGYVPSEKEKFMCDTQREYFRRKLVKWKEDLERGAGEVMQYLQEGSQSSADSTDRASSETDLTYELRSKERASRLILKIDSALQRIKNGTYGYCEETGDPISLKRLEARPVATLGIEAQMRHEKQERVHRDD